MKTSIEGQKTLKFFMPVTKYYTKEDGKEHWIAGRGSDTALDRDGDRIDIALLQSWADMINNSEVGLGSFPDHQIHIDNIAAIHRTASIEADPDGINYLIINSILNPAHPQFKYYLTCLEMKAPFFYSICVLEPLFKEEEDGTRLIVGGDLISVDFVPVPANPRTWVSMKGGSYLSFENYAVKSREEDKMDEKRIEKLEEAVSTLTEQVTQLVKAQTQEAEKAKEKEDEAEKSVADTFFKKLEEIEKQLEKLSRESTGRDSGTPITNITEKQWKDMTSEQKSLIWQKLVRGES
ncbi:MAG: hypothetical protein HXS43_12025 [Theionarchaea archaeon]|nr:hypothetical protein [Theionarchaea archaeon]